MQKITFKDYEKAIKTKYEIEKEGEYAKHFNPTAQANLRDLCWERFKENDSKDDLSTFFSFFIFNFEANATVNKKLRDETDKFKTIASFYLKDDKKTVSRYAIELAAILVDFEPRPYKKFREVGVILKENPIEPPRIPFAFSNIKERENEIEENNFKNTNEAENGNSTEKEIPPIDNKPKGKLNYLKLFKKSKRTLIGTSIIFVSVATIISLLVFKKGCMQWSDNHYELVYCDKPIEGNLNEVILKDDNLIDFKKLQICDTSTCFKPDGEAIVWYAKRGDKAEFFNANGNGRHPETKRSLRPITEYIKGKYKGDCLAK